MTEGISAKQAARDLGIEPRVLRKFLRSDASPFEPVGQGQRYVFDTEDMKVLEKAFADAHPKKATRKVHYHEPEEAEEIMDPAEAEAMKDDEFFDLKEIDLGGPSDDELAEIEFEELEDDI